MTCANAEPADDERALLAVVAVAEMESQPLTCLTCLTVTGRSVRAPWVHYRSVAVATN